MGTKQILVCEVCGRDVPDADRRSRVSVRDATNPYDERELPGALEACAACVPEASAAALERALSAAAQVPAGLVSSFAVRIDVLPLRAAGVRAAADAPDLLRPAGDWRAKIRAGGRAP